MLSPTDMLWEQAQERFDLLSYQHAELLDQLRDRDEHIHTLRKQNHGQLGVINQQAQAIAQVLELVYDKHLVRTEEIMRILEAVAR